MNTTFVDQVNTPGALTPEEMERAQHLYEDILLQTDSSRVTGRIARTYAEALLATAKKRGEEDAIGEQFRSLGKDVFPNVPGLEALLDSAAVNKHARDALLVKLFEGRSTPLFLDFLRVLNHKDRLGILRLIAVAYRSLRDTEANRLRVLVESASPLDDAQKQKLTELLTATLGKTPVLIVRTKPELIGGLVVHIGDTVYDTSLRYKLQSARTKLLARGSHEIQSRRDRFSHR